MDTSGPGCLETGARIILLGRDGASLHALRLLLESRMQVSAVECRSMSEYLDMQQGGETASIVVIDVDTFNGDLAWLLGRLRIVNPVPSVIVLSAKVEIARGAADAGVDEIVSKSDPPKRLLSAVERLRIRSEDAQ